MGETPASIYEKVDSTGKNSYFDSADERSEAFDKGLGQVDVIQCEKCEEDPEITGDKIATINADNILKKISKDAGMGVATSVSMALIAAPPIGALVFLVGLVQKIDQLNMKDIENWSRGEFEKAEDGGTIVCKNGHHQPTARADHIAEMIEGEWQVN